MSRASNSHHVKLLNGVRIKKPLFYKYLARVFVFTFALSVLFGVVYYQLQEPVELRLAVDVAQPEVVPLSPLAELLALHQATTGYSQAESLAVGGIYTTQGVDFDLEILSKKPKLFRQSLLHRGLEVSAGYDGQQYWQSNPPNRCASEMSPQVQLNDQLLALECSLTALVWQYEKEGSAGLKLMADEAVGERMCRVIRNSSLLAQPVYHYLDTETGFELRRRTTLMAQGQSFEVMVDYSSVASGSRVAGYALSLNGELQAAAIITSIRPNVGVMPWMFRSPTGNQHARWSK